MKKRGFLKRIDDDDDDDDERDGIYGMMRRLFSCNSRSKRETRGFFFFNFLQ